MYSIGETAILPKGEHRCDRIAYRPLEAAEAVGVSRTEIYRWLRSGRLSARKHGRSVLILREDLEKFVRSGENYVGQ